MGIVWKAGGCSVGGLEPVVWISSLPRSWAGLPGHLVGVH